MGNLYPDLPFDADGQLLVEPYLDGLMLLQELEDEVDRGQQNPSAAATASAAHDDRGSETVVWVVCVLAKSRRSATGDKWHVAGVVSRGG